MPKASLESQNTDHLNAQRPRSKASLPRYTLSDMTPREARAEVTLVLAVDVVSTDGDTRSQRATAQLFLAALKANADALARVFNDFLVKQDNAQRVHVTTVEQDGGEG